MPNSINLKIGGLQGEGVDKTGIILSKYLTRLGFSTFGYREYRSVIKGGHTTYQIHADTNPVYSQIHKVNLLIALDQNTVLWHQGELNQDSIILYDPSDFKLPSNQSLIGNYLKLPLLKITKEAGGIPLMANMTALGAVCAYLNLPLKALFAQIAHIFSQKGHKIIKANQTVAQAGHDYFKTNFKRYQTKLTLPSKIKHQIVLFGNEAIAAGAVAGGMKLYCAYPMTPSSSILHYLAAYAKNNDLVVKHTEDEISAINMAIGGSFAGVRSMTGTSGGGFCLMTEGLGLAGVSETPLVVINSQRPGPALGMPTWTAQGDLQFCIHASQDEFLRIVLAPGNPDQAFHLTKQAFILAEKYQLPVIILVDKYVSESISTCPIFTPIHSHSRHGITDQPAKDYLRYKVTANGVSPRTLPGTANGMYICNSYEHDETGHSTEKADDRVKQMNKRALKLKTIISEIFPQEEFGDSQAKTGIICWGSTYGPVKEALKTAKAKAIHLSWLWPFPRQQVNRFIKNCQNVLIVEGNSQSQLGNLLKQELQVAIQHKLLKYDGRPFYPAEIKNYIHQINKNND